MYVNVLSKCFCQVLCVVCNVFYVICVRWGDEQAAPFEYRYVFYFIFKYMFKRFIYFIVIIYSYVVYDYLLFGCLCGCHVASVFAAAICVRASV